MLFYPLPFGVGEDGTVGIFALKSGSQMNGMAWHAMVEIWAMMSTLNITVSI